MIKYEFSKIRLEAANDRGKGNKLSVTYLLQPDPPKPMPGGASESNMLRHIGTMGQDGWQLVSVEKMAVGDGQTDHIFWLQRSR